jgi:hypothetical protein
LPGIAVEAIGIDRRDVAPKAFGDLLVLAFAETGLRGPDREPRIGYAARWRVTGAEAAVNPAASLDTEVNDDISETNRHAIRKNIKRI